MTQLTGNPTLISAGALEQLLATGAPALNIPMNIPEVLARLPVSKLGGANAGYHCLGQMTNSVLGQSNPGGANVLTAVPFYMPRAVVLQDIAQNIAGASGNGRFGIYAADQNTLYPANLLVDSGSFAAGGGVRIVATPGLSLPIGWYHGAFLTDTGVPTFLAPGNGVAYSVFGLDNTLSSPRSLWSVAFAFAALPATFPAGAVIGGGGTASPMIFARFASVI